MENLWHEPTETENPNENDNDEELLSELQGVSDWLQELKHGLVDDSAPERRDTSSSSHELHLEPRATVVKGNHNISTLLKDRNFDMCLRTKITRASCRRRAGTVVPREENIGDLKNCISQTSK